MKNTKTKISKSLKILNKIEKIRSRNNKNWMDIVRLAIKLDYNRTAKLIKEIYNQDTRISKLAKKIYSDKG